MNDRNEMSSDRREFLQRVGTAAVVGTSIAALSHSGPIRGADAPDAKVDLPRRKLGNTGVDVTILNQGTWQSPSLDRLVRFSYANGVRYFDTAKAYGTEPGLAKWLTAEPEVRKSIFLVTKDHPNTPKALIAQLDQRLASLKTDYVDLFFIHGIGSDYPDVSIDWPKSQEFKETIAAIKKSGKAKFVGFSCHDQKRAAYLRSAAEGGFVDAIMVQHTAWLDRETELNKALDACHKRGIGLISMKQIAGPNPKDFLAEVPKKAPDLIAKGLSPFGALLHAIWTDERFATCCVSMKNTDQIRENVAAARSFAPLKTAEIESVRQAFLASRPTLCAACDGRCSEAAGTEAPLGDLTRYLTYYERHGSLAAARRAYAELSEAGRDWAGADLEAARAACPSHLDFASLMPRVSRHLA